MLTVNPQSSEVEPGAMVQEETSLAVGQATWGVPRCVRRRAFSGAQGQIFLPCDLCLMRKVVYGLLPWERKLVDVMMEDLGSALFGGAKKKPSSRPQQSQG